MILATQDLQKLQVLEKCRWNNAACKYLVAPHPLGTIFWGLRTKESISQCICATYQNVRDNYAEQVLNIISAEQNITSKKCLDEWPLFVHDILCYYRDQLVLKPHFAELRLSREDEKMLSLHKKNLMEMTDENKWLKGFAIFPFLERWIFRKCASKPANRHAASALAEQ